MSTATAAPTLGQATAARDFLADKVKWLRHLAAKLIAASAKPLEFAQALKDSIFKAVGSIPVPVATAIAAATVATESGYERVRGGAYMITKAVGKTISSLVRFAINAAATTVTTMSGLFGERVHTKTASLMSRATTSVLTAWNKVAGFSSLVASHVFCALGHRTAVRTITTGASLIAVATSIEVATTVAGLPTLSGLLGGTPLAGTVATAVLSSTGIGFAALGGLVVVGGTVAWLANRSDVNDMVHADAAARWAETDARRNDATKETVESVMEEADALKAEKEGLESVVLRSQRPHRK